MTHGDDKGLVAPPRVAPKQLVMVPIPKASTPPDDKKVRSFLRVLARMLVACLYVPSRFAPERLVMVPIPKASTTPDDRKVCLHRAVKEMVA
eukprot:scaffold235347_cov20-Tisochrysis_lutea.AAC.2